MAPGEHDHCPHSLGHHLGRLVQVNIKKGEIQRKKMASFQNFVNCSHNPSLVFKVAQVLGITLK